MTDSNTMVQREQLLTASQQLTAWGLNKGTSGNVSVRTQQGFLVTPSGMAVEAMDAASMVHMQWDGTAEVGKKPSSEWRFHRDILQAQPNANAVVHTHSTFATTLACLRKRIPAFHYMIAIAGGDSIECADYALFGSQALSDNALQALAERKACLLANHGMIATGRDLPHALSVALEVENLAEQYCLALQVGEPVLLTGDEMRAVFAQFKGYANWD
ncbi:MAG: class II aldolase/adducin family protein [Methylotenera sp.]|nr:class II aldolase/adducin family protein [Methylotenera sp.]